MRLAEEAGALAEIESSSLEAQQALAAAIYAHGDGLFQEMCQHAHAAALALRFEFHACANWWTAKNRALPFRMVLAALDKNAQGIALVYTRASLKGNENPHTERDFLELRIQAPSNRLILLHAARVVSITEALEMIYRRAFLQTA
jgi:hypothetical protein